MRLGGVTGLAPIFNPRRAALPPRAGGFTLLEVVIVAAIVAILTAIAYPSYMEFVRRGNRADAKAILMETSQFMERHFTTNSTYVGAALVSTVSPKGATGAAIRYNISYSAGPAATTYTVQAVPAGPQAIDSCGTLTIANTGAVTPTTGGCW